MPDPVTGIIGATAGSGLISAFGAKSAAGKIGDAAASANQLANMRWEQMLGLFKEMFAKGEAGVKPYMDMGTASANKLTQGMNEFTAPITMDQETLEKTPGYEFLKTQGMRAVTGQNVLRGLSGAQLKGAADFVKGLSDTTYKTQFDVANTNKTNAFNRLFQTSEAGRAAGTSLLQNAVSGSVGMASPGIVNAVYQGQNTMAGGQAAGQADMAMAKAGADTLSSLPYAPFIANKLYTEGKFGARGMFSGEDTGNAAG